MPEVHQPVIEALALIGRYAKAGNLTFYPIAEVVLSPRGTAGDWADLLHRVPRGRTRVTRMVYEVVTFQAQREQLRCKEIWVVGSDSRRNPDDDLPQTWTSDAARIENYGELRKPLDPRVFVDGLSSEMSSGLDGIEQPRPRLGLAQHHRPLVGCNRPVQIRGSPEPRNLRRIKAEVQRQMGHRRLDRPRQ